MWCAVPPYTQRKHRHIQAKQLELHNISMPQKKTEFLPVAARLMEIGTAEALFACLVLLPVEKELKARDKRRLHYTHRLHNLNAFYAC